MYGNKWQYEIDRLTYLKQFNPSIREDEIARLQKLQKEGLSLLDGLSATPEAIQVMVVSSLKFYTIKKCSFRAAFFMGKIQVYYFFVGECWPVIFLLF